MKFIFQSTGKLILKSITWVYLQYYPIDTYLKNIISQKAIGAKGRIDKINELRVNNIKGAFWSSSGTVFSLFLTLMSLFFALIWSLSILIDYTNIKNEFKMEFAVLIIFISILIVALLTLGITPILLRKIIKNLPPKLYAELSLSNLSQSDILTLVSYRMWEISRKFTKELSSILEFNELFNENGGKGESKKIYDIVNSDMDINEMAYKRFTNKKTDESKSRLYRCAKELSDAIKKFKSEYYEELMKCQAIKYEAVSKLKILPREFCHHILKFSPAIFEARVNSFKWNVDSLQFILDSKDKEKEGVINAFNEALKEVYRIYYDVKERRERSLIQLIIFPEIHEHLIGLSSITSTSHSLKIFTRGVTYLCEKLECNISEEKKISEEFKALIHRTKAHYGMDLLISVENFYKKNFSNHPKKDIPDYLFEIRKDNNTDLFIKHKGILKEIRTDIAKNNTKAMKIMNEKFDKALKKIDKPNAYENIYFVSFGYSKMVRNIIKNNTEKLKKLKAKIFVMKETGSEMLDTRILRFELNDQKPNKNYRESFTADDDVLFNLINGQDKLIFIGGIEAYDKSKFKLLHTNNYQVRVERLLKRFEKNNNKPNPEVWLIGEDYKIFEQFPPKDSKFGIEFFSDHYDKIDFYDFSKLKKNKKLKIISNEVKIKINN